MVAPRSFVLSADDRAVLDAADKFASKEFVPLARRMDDEEWWPPDIFQRIGAAGFMGVTVPAEHGGAGKGSQQQEGLGESAHGIHVAGLGM